MSNIHNPVLLHESIEALEINSEGIYVDGTFGRGGHAHEILERLTTGKLIAFDRDIDAVNYGKEMFKAKIASKHLILVHEQFSMMQEILNKYRLSGKINGILLDLGVSSPQIDVAERGFSFMKNGPLDMRMDQTKGICAQEVLIKYNVKDLSNIFYNYGEERYAWKIAKAIKETLAKGRLLNQTLQLSQLIKETVGKRERKNPATRCFQSLRIFVNNEIHEITKTLSIAFRLLKQSGNLVVISFHSLEDRIIKAFMRGLVQGDDGRHIFPRKIPIPKKFVIKAKWHVKKKRASCKEIKMNPRSHSATLRSVKKI